MAAREPIRNVHPKYAGVPVVGTDGVVPRRYFAEISGFARLRHRYRVVSAGSNNRPGMGDDLNVRRIGKGAALPRPLVCDRRTTAQPNPDRSETPETPAGAAPV